MEEHKRPWQPLTPLEVLALFKEAEFPWWIAGGYAIEHAVGRSLRSHGDIDVVILRKDHLSVRDVLIAWDCWAAGYPDGLRRWRANESLPSTVHDIWCRQQRDSPWQLQLMLDEGDNNGWHSRRNALVTKPLAALGTQDEAGIPFLAVEVQLFYKAKAPRPKDELDFAAALPILTRSQRAWLRDAITIAYSREHAWLEKIA